jgi:hypothetical protein
MDFRFVSGWRGSPLAQPTGAIPISRVSASVAGEHARRRTDLGTNELIASLTFAATALNWHYPISGGTYAFSSH